MTTTKQRKARAAKARAAIEQLLDREEGLEVERPTLQEFAAMIERGEATLDDFEAAEIEYSVRGLLDHVVAALRSRAQEKIARYLQGRELGEPRELPAAVAQAFVGMLETGEVLLADFEALDDDERPWLAEAVTDALAIIDSKPFAVYVGPGQGHSLGAWLSQADAGSEKELQALHAVFDSVRDPDDWRAPIAALVPKDFLASATIAVEFFTAAKVQPLGESNPQARSWAARVLGTRDERAAEILWQYHKEGTPADLVAAAGILAGELLLLECEGYRNGPAGP